MQLVDPRVEYRSLDLTRPRVVHDLLWEAQTLEIDTVINAKQHREDGDAGRTVHAQNVDATRELVLGCVDHPTIRRFVHRSYAELYTCSRTTTNVIDEHAPLDVTADMGQWLRDRFDAELAVCSAF